MGLGLRGPVHGTVAMPSPRGGDLSWATVDGSEEAASAAAVEWVGTGASARSGPAGGRRGSGWHGGPGGFRPPGVGQFGGKASATAGEYDAG